MPTYRLDVAYDGTNLFGWQIQPGRRTVQEDLENALGVILRTKIRIIGAGRTDTGVHARGQVASFRIDGEISNERKVLHSLNCILPEDIAVLDFRKAPDEFHARFSAQYREYAYSIALVKPTTDRLNRWHLRYIVDWGLIDELLPTLIGAHDFTAFCASGSSTRDKRCEVLFFSLEQAAIEKVFHIRSNRFLYRMVRSVVGTLIDIGRGELPAENLQKALDTGDRSLIGDTAPARGLTLVEVGY
jgi:tRNA pseudouridine38-40 synthase